MGRHRNVEWNLPDGTPSPTGGTSHSWESIQVAVLMDIREQLIVMNTKLGVLRCPDFMAIPRVLYDIRRQTKRKTRTVKKKAKLRAVS